MYLPSFSPFEGISASGQRWEWRTRDADAVAQVERYLEVSETLARVLVGRGQQPESIPDFLTPTLRAHLPDPFHLKDMDKAVDRLIQAIQSQETVAVFGDYDVDGATSSALLVRYFRMLGRTLLVHIPDRQKEGYGPNAPALLALQAKGATLVITVDCGAVSFAPLKAAADAGLDVIVLDHHKGAAELPAAVAVVNPNRLDEHSPHTHMAAVGVTFLTLVALNKRLREAGYFLEPVANLAAASAKTRDFENRTAATVEGREERKHRNTRLQQAAVDSRNRFVAERPEPNLMGLLDLVALGTVCDVVSLTGVNRAFVTQGLRVLSARTNAGLATMLELAGVHGDVTAYHLGFVLGPRINAGGRVGESDLGVRLLTGEEPPALAEIAGRLNTHNAERQAIEMLVLEQAFAQAESQANMDMVLVAGQGWHAGVIGIVASRLKDRYHRPAAVIALDGESGKASARSVSGVDMGAAIVAARESGVIVEGGGHAMAGGFSLQAGQVDAVHQFFLDHIAPAMTRYHESRALLLDAPITTAMATPATVTELERASPYGMGNPSPVLVVQDARLLSCDIVKEQHLRLTVTDASGGRLKAMCFRAIGSPLGDALLGARGKTLALAGSLKLELWQNRPQVTFMVQDVRL